MMAIGAGAKAQVEAAFAAMGTNVLIILPGSTSTSGVHGGFGSDAHADVGRPGGNSHRCIHWSKRPRRRFARAWAVISEEQNWTTSITGTSSRILSEIRNWPIALGNLDHAPRRQKAERKSSSWAKRSSTSSMVRARTRFPDRRYASGARHSQVVGVASRKGQICNGPGLRRRGIRSVHYVCPQGTGGPGQVSPGLDHGCGDVLRGHGTRPKGRDRAPSPDRHHLAGGDDDDFSIRNLSEIAGAQQQGTETMTLLLASVAAVSLLVGGIGIMNIMLVSVTERTREIGIRMAVGAEPQHVLLQFLIEALSLSVAGGLLGVGFGVGVAAWLAGRFHWPVLVQPTVILVSVGFSGLVGVVFGI